MADFDPTSLGAVPVRAFDPASIGAVPVEHFDPTSIGAVSVSSPKSQSASSALSSINLQDFIKSADPNALAPGLASTGEGADLEGMHVKAGGPGGLPLAQELDKPLIELPKPQNTGVISGSVRGAETAIEGMVNLKNFGLAAATSVLPAPLQKLVAYGFGAAMSKQIPEHVAAFNAAQTSGEKAEAAAAGIVNTGMAALAVAHGASSIRELPEGITRPSGTSQQEIDSALKSAPEPQANADLNDQAVDSLVSSRDAAQRAAEDTPGAQNIADHIAYQLKNIPPERITESRERIAQQSQSPVPGGTATEGIEPTPASAQGGTSSLFTQAKAEIAPETNAAAKEAGVDIPPSASPIPDRFKKVVDAEIGGLHEAQDEGEALDHMEGIEDDNVRRSIAEQYGIETKDKSANDLNMEIASKAMEVKEAAHPEHNGPIAAEFEPEEQGVGLPKQQLGGGGTMTKRVSGSEGPGAAAATEFPALQKIDIRNATVDERRTTEGNLKLLNEEAQSNPATWAEMEKRVDQDPNYGGEVVDRIRDGRLKTPDHVEQAALIHESVRVKNMRDQWAERAADPNTTEAERAEAKAEWQKQESRLNEVDQATKIAGTSAGRALQIRQMQINDDFTHSGIERKMRAAKGEGLSESESANAKVQADEFEKMKRERDKAQSDYQEASEKAASADTYEKALKAAQKELADRPKISGRVMEIARKIVDRWSKDADAARQSMRDRLSRASAGVDPAIVLDVARIMRGHIGELGLKAAEISARVLSEFGDDVKPFLKDAWTKAQELVNKEKVEPNVREAAKSGAAKKELNLTDIKARSKAEATAEEPLSHKTVFDIAHEHIKTGLRGDAVMEATLKDVKEAYPDATLRDVHRAYGEYGKVTFPSKDEVKMHESELRRIVQLKESIDRLKEGQDPLHTGQQRAKATQAIREKTKELNELLKKHEGPPSPENLASRDQAKQTALRNRIEDLDKQLRTGEKSAKGEPIKDSPQTEQLRAERDAMAAKLKEIEYAAKPKPTPEEMAHEQAQQAVDRAAAAFDRQQRINSGEIKPEAKEKVQSLSPLEKELRDKTEELRKEKRDSEKATPEQKAADAAQKEVDRAAAALDRQERINKGEIKPEKTEKKQPLTELAKQLRDRTEELRKSKRDTESKSPTERYNETRLKAVQKQLDEAKERLRTGNFSPKPKPTPYQKFEPLQKAQAELDRVKDKVNRNIARIASENRTKSQKFWDAFVGVERAMKLSSDVVLAKLTLAAAVREGALTPVEEVVGGAVSKVLPRLAYRAPREGGFSTAAELNAKVQMFTIGMKDAWDNLRMRKSDLEATHGNKTPKPPPSWYEYLGFLHGALKAPVKRAEFARSLTKRMEAAERTGNNINSPETMLRISQEAYLDANRSIFMQDNVVSKAFNAATGMMAKSKIAPNLGPALDRIAHFLVPIVKVPTNIVGEVATGIHGTATGSIRAANAYANGIDSLPLEQADAIMRQLKKGLIGNSILLTGYLGYKSIGGFYHAHDQREKDDVQAGRYRVGDVDLPTAVGHSTAGMLMNVGATLHRVEDEKLSKSQGGGPKGIGSGALAAGSGLVKELPAVPAITGLATALESEEGLTKYIHEMITSTVDPGILQHAAKLQDTPGSFPSNILAPSNRRDVKTAADAVRVGFPYAREQVPLKKSHR